MRSYKVNKGNRNLGLSERKIKEQIWVTTKLVIKLDAQPMLY